MTVYIAILILVLFITVFCNTRCVENEIRLGPDVQYRKVPTKFITFLVCAILIFFFAARWQVGTDFPNYFSRFHKLLDMDIPELVGSRDWGFYVLSAAIGQYVSDNYFIYSLILGVIIYVPVIFTYRKYSVDFAMTCAMYIMMCAYTWPYNGMRQSIAVTILFAGYHFIYDRKDWWKYIVLVAIAFTFHSTAVMVVPFILLTRLKPTKKPFLFTCVVILLLIVFLPNLWTTIIDFLENIGQSKMAEDYADYEDLRGGVNILRILVAAAPVVISYIFYKPLKKANPQIDILITMSVMNLIFLVFGTQLTVLSRFRAYFNIALPLLVPNFINIFEEKSKMPARFLLYGAYFLHMIVLLPNDSGLIPYRFIFGYI